jgi:hypothetical protein
MEQETAVAVEPQETKPDMLATIAVIIASVFQPLIGIAVGAALRLTGSDEVKKTGTTCMLIGGILWAMQMLTFLFIMMAYFVMIFVVIAATSAHRG